MNSVQSVEYWFKQYWLTGFQRTKGKRGQKFKVTRGAFLRSCTLGRNTSWHWVEQQKSITAEPNQHSSPHSHTDRRIMQYAWILVQQMHAEDTHTHTPPSLERIGFPSVSSGLLNIKLNSFPTEGKKASPTSLGLAFPLSLQLLRYETTGARSQQWS